MTKGKRTYDGLAVPLDGESEITQQIRGTDVLTLTSVANAYTAVNILEIGITATSAQTAGYLLGAHVSMNMDGGGTGGQAVQSIAFGADITIDGTFSHGVYGAYYYFQEGSTGSTPTAGAMVGVQTYFAAFGASMDYRVGFWATSAETSSFQASGVEGAFLAECGASGSWKNLIVAHGGPPSYFLAVTGAPGEEQMISTAVRANIAASDMWLKCDVNGTDFWIALHASCSS
jgi:hypothetical protein